MSQTFPVEVTSDHGESALVGELQVTDEHQVILRCAGLDESTPEVRLTPLVEGAASLYEIKGKAVAMNDGPGRYELRLADGAELLLARVVAGSRDSKFK